MKLPGLARTAFCLLSACCLGGTAAAANDYPARQPVRLVVTFSPGGGADTIARSINDKLSQTLGQTVIVENKPGAGGTIATDHVAKATPDGYTALFTVSSHSINQALYPNLPFDTERDLRGVTLVGTLPQVLVVHPSVPANTLQEWLQLMKTDERYSQYGTGGIGSPGHFAGELLSIATKTPFTHVPYKGAGPAMTDAIGNQVPAALVSLGGATSHITAGTLKPLAITSTERLPALPNVPTMAESGVDGYESDTWIGIFLPSGTPDDIVKKLHEATYAALQDPVVRERIESKSGRVIAGPPEELDRIVAADIVRYTRIVQEQGLAPQ